MEKSPDAFRTISEVAEWLDVPTHVLRFWESRFSQVKPVKRAGGRRYYRPADMQLIGGIKRLLHDDGMTIRGVQKLLREEGVKHVSGFSQPLEHELDTVIELKAAHAEPEPEAVMAPEPQTAESTEVKSEDEDAAPEPREEPVLSFGSVRKAEPELPFEPEKEAPDLIDEATLSPADAVPETEPEPEPVEASHGEAVDPAEPLHAIPSTPEVPETDADDDAPAHSAPPGYAARLIVRDRRANQPEATMLAAIIDALRQVRDRDAL